VLREKEDLRIGGRGLSEGQTYEMRVRGDDLGEKLVRRNSRNKALDGVIKQSTSLQAE
jgi:hypothetical protein